MKPVIPIVPPAVDITKDETDVPEVTEEIIQQEAEPTPVPVDKPIIAPVPPVSEVVEKEETLQATPVEPPTCN